MRLIDADAVVEKITRKANSGQWSEEVVYGMAKALYLVKSAQTIERPHGKWDRGFCSVCGERSLRTTQTGEIFGIEHTPFCKNCGADMRTKDGQICETMMGW